MVDKRGQTTGEFREQLVLRAIYEVGHDPSVLSNYVGLRREYVITTCIKYRKQAMKAARDFLQGKQATLSVFDQIKGIGKAIGEKFERRRSLNLMKKKFGAQVRNAVARG